VIPLLSALVSGAKRHHVAVLLAAVVVAIVAGGVAFAITQGTGLSTGLYWSLVTAATVGYGDVTPHNEAGRIVAAGVILTAIPLLASAFALVSAFAAATKIRRALAMEHKLPDQPYSVVFGWNASVPAVLDELARSGKRVVLVADLHGESVTVNSAVHVIAADPSTEAAVRKAHPADAADAVVMGTDDGDILLTCIAVRALAPGLAMTAVTNSSKVAGALHELGIDRTVSSDRLLAHTVAKSLEAPHAGELLLQLVDSQRYLMTEEAVDEQLIGKHVSQASADGRIPLGLIRDGKSMLVLDSDPTLRSGDQLVTLTAQTEPAGGDDRAR